MSVKSYEDLRVWQSAMDLVVLCYKATASFPAEERFGLTSQMRRSEVSIPSNIAEGHARSHLREYLNFISIAKGSAAELNTQVWIAQRIELIDTQTAEQLRSEIASVGRMLSALKKALSDTSTQSPVPRT